MSKLLTEPAAARYLGVRRSTLRDLRCRGEVRAAGYVRFRTPVYDTDELDDYQLSVTPHRTYDFGDERVTVVYDEEAP